MIISITPGIKGFIIGYLMAFFYFTLCFFIIWYSWILKKVKNQVKNH